MPAAQPSRGLLWLSKGQAPFLTPLGFEPERSWSCDTGRHLVHVSEKSRQDPSDGTLEQGVLEGRCRWLGHRLGEVRERAVGEGGKSRHSFRLVLGGRRREQKSKAGQQGDGLE